MPIAQLAEQFNRALAFYDRFLDELTTQRMSYNQNRVIPGRIAGPEPVPIELLADQEHGLYGFRSPPEEPLAKKRQS
jgi:hypothetical protein